MGPADPITIKLDRAREVRWTNRAAARNASLTRPVQFLDLTKPNRRLYAVCAIIWATLVDSSHEFESPEDLAEFFATETQQLDALDAIKRMVDEAFPQKKSGGKKNTSDAGPAPSSTAGLAQG